MTDDDPISDDTQETAAAVLDTPPPHQPPVETATGADDEGEPAAKPAPASTDPASNKKWYVIKVQSGREESIKAAIERKVKIEGLEEFFGQVIIPVERVTEVKKTKETKNGEKVTKERRVVKEKKKFPGYLMAEVEFNDKVLYLFRETGGVGDFVGAAPGKPPVPMSDREVAVMLGSMLPEKDRGKMAPTKTKVKLDFETGDKVRIREGAFANMEGEVKEITEPKEASETPKVSVEVSIFGRPVKVELDYWQVDKA
jgi:transcriptional antiterminator NusG